MSFLILKINLIPLIKVQTIMSEKNNLSAIEHIKVKSRGLRGTLKESLMDEITGTIREDDRALIKFHGMYVQDDRDLREERAAKKLDKLHSFMIRLRIPGGKITPEQWIAIHHIAGNYSTGVIKITTRQTVQLHGILKKDIKPTIQDFDQAKLDSISACGDVNRNVTCTSLPSTAPVHDEIKAYAAEISKRFLPKTNAYYEIWLDDDKIVERNLKPRADEKDDLFQDRYFPRKFKIGIGIPPNNDVDVLINDLGLIAIIENEKLVGFNVAVGGGLSSTHGNANTYPRAASVICFVPIGDQLFKAIYETMTIQRDFGNRSDRKFARLKYTVDNMGLDGFKKELETRCGFILQPARVYKFNERKDIYGWQKDYKGLWHYTLFIDCGRVVDDETQALKTALLQVAETGKCNFNFTCNQNLILCDIKSVDKLAIENILLQFNVVQNAEKASQFRKNSIACVALNTCPLALAEAQRFLPKLIDEIEPILKKHQLQDDEIVVRMTGCPNGCGRSSISEIGFIGTSMGHYNLHLGGDREGMRLNKLYKEALDEGGILTELDNLFGIYKAEKNSGERFGDFAIRRNWVTE